MEKNPLPPTLASGPHSTYPLERGLAYLADKILEAGTVLAAALATETPIDAAKRVVGRKSIDVGLDEAQTMQQEDSPFPLVRYELPDKRWFRWTAKAAPNGRDYIPIYEVIDPASGQVWRLVPQAVGEE